MNTPTHDALRKKLQTLKSAGPKPPFETRRELPCLYEGDVVEPCKTCAGEKGHVRECDKYGRCTRTDRGKGVAICSSCPDYTPDPSLQPVPKGWLLVPQPEPLDLQPKTKWAVVTVVVGEEAQRCHRAGRTLLERFCNRVGCDLVVLDRPGHPAWPISAKFNIARTLDHYERILYVDADTLLRPGCVNPFDLCGEGEFGFVDELAEARLQPSWGTETRYLKFRQEMGFRLVPKLPFYVNSGVMVVPASHKHLLLPPTRPMPTFHCSEQDAVAAQLLDSGLPYRLLDKRCNWQSWVDPGFQAAPTDAILHWSGGGVERQYRAETIKQWAEKYL